MFTIVLTTIGLALWKPEHAPRVDHVPFRERIALLRLVFPIIILFATVTGVLYSGIATPTEISAIGALGALMIYFVRSRPSFRQLLSAVSRATMTTCMLAAIILGAHVFSTFFALTQTTSSIVFWISNLPVASWVIMVALVAVIIILGFFMDTLAIMVLTIPVVAPLLNSLGYDLVWFGVIMIVSIELGLVTPPVGLNAFVVAKSAGVPAAEVFWGVAPHIVTHLIALAILLIFPILSLWLPSGI